MLFVDVFFSQELHRFAQSPTKATRVHVHVHMRVCTHAQIALIFILILKNKNSQILPDFLHTEAPHSVSGVIIALFALPPATE